MMAKISAYFIFDSGLPHSSFPYPGFSDLTSAWQ
jgi:hypothetical protein